MAPRADWLAHSALVRSSRLCMGYIIHGMGIVQGVNRHDPKGSGTAHCEIRRFASAIKEIAQAKRRLP